MKVNNISTFQETANANQFLFITIFNESRATRTDWKQVQLQIFMV